MALEIQRRTAEHDLGKNYTDSEIGPGCFMFLIMVPGLTEVCNARGLSAEGWIYSSEGTAQKNGLDGVVKYNLT